MSETTAPLAGDEFRGTTEVAPAWTAWAFAGATLLGAFLLFQIQPLISKFILPWFGGAPAVWTTCMLFFQIVLFGGYAYSHLLVSRLSPRGQAIAQGLLLLAAIAVLPIAPSDVVEAGRQFRSHGPHPLALDGDGGVAVFRALDHESVDPVVVQSEFPRPHAVSPVRAVEFRFLPGLVELPVRLRAGLRPDDPVEALVVGLSRVCRAARHLRSGRLAIEPAAARACQPDAQARRARPPVAAGLRCQRPRWFQRVLWLLLPACASLVLLATTNHVCQDVAVVPFLWVVPLSLYLLTFIICFDHSRWYVRPLWAFLTVLGIAAVMGGDKMLDWVGEHFPHEGMSLTYTHELVLNFGTMFCICMICHGELVRLRPDPRHLTEFYLMLSAGGALGGVAVSLAAPHLFKTFLEWNIGMLVAYAMAAVVLFLAVPKTGRRRPAAFLLFGFAVGGFIPVLLWQWDRARRPRPIRGLSIGSGISTASSRSGKSTIPITPTSIASA